jgi:hypothetical protein
VWSCRGSGERSDPPPGDGRRGILALSVFARTLLAAQVDAVPDAAAYRIAEPVRIDGVLDESLWSSVDSIGRLLQQEPVPESDPTEETEVRVLYDRDNLYFGILCRDREPSRIVATQLVRDGDFEIDDRIVVILDPFFDFRNGFFFEVNPLGARADGQVANNAEQRTLEWDGIWEARARITDEGWTAEIAIPFKTLRFRPGETTWGLNVERTIKRKNEIDRWASPRREVWLTNLSQAGRLNDLDGVEQGRGLDIRPYVSAGGEDGDAEVDAGVDVFKNITPSLNASVSVNTDFAETEVDARQVNLTRFPLFLPEKRPFFLEGSGVFEVAGLQPREEADLIPFFSRRIGLLAGEEVPILVGTKLVGREHGFNLGVLDVQTRETEIEELGTLSTENLLAARVSKNLLRQSWIGGILTHGNPGGTGDNTLFGVDARFATSTFRGDKNLSLDLYALGTKDELLAATDSAFGFKLDYPNERWDVGITGIQIGEDFRARLGFVPRTGIRKIRPFASFRPRAPQIGIRRFNFELFPEIVTDLEGRVLDWEVFTAPLNIRTESQEHIEWNYIPVFQRLDVPFEIRPGIVIPAGDYRWTRYRFEVNTADKRPWVVDFGWWWGSFYEGRLRQLELGFTWKPSPHLFLEVESERNTVELPQGDFVATLYEFRADYSFSPDISWANLVQYDSDSGILGFQSRFRWILTPGRDLFVVYNRGWQDFENRAFTAFERGSVKFQYTFRL